jgi:hypothetical protein
MRQFLLILMIATLPLRAWAGDVMAVGMSTRHMIATITVAEYAIPTRANGHFHGELMAEPSVQPAHHANAAAGTASHTHDHRPAPKSAALGHCEPCGDCQICHNMALTTTLMPLAPEQASQSLKPALGHSFASAALATQLKPPIS